MVNKNFQVGDRVRILYNGFPLSFTIGAIEEGEQSRIYQDKISLRWYHADRLEYDLDDTDLEWLTAAERRIHALSFAVMETKDFIEELMSKDLAPSLKQKLSASYKDAIGA